MRDQVQSIPAVQDWQWDLAARMRVAMEDVFAEKPDEVRCLEALVREVAGTTPIKGTLQGGGGFELLAESTFLHGHRSQVRFKLGGTDHQRELADLLVVASYVEDGALRYQRLCFLQAKRAEGGVDASARYGIDKWQLALLTSFPRFQGVEGLFKGQDLRLRNRSGALGAYGLLSPPGDLSVVSSRVLSHVLGGRQSLTSRELVPAMLSENAAMRGFPRTLDEIWPVDPLHCPDCERFAMHFFPFPSREWHRFLTHHRSHHGAFIEPAASVLTCLGLDEFLQAWTGLRLGEVWYPGAATQSDQALLRCVADIVGTAQAAGSDLGGLSDLLPKQDDLAPMERVARPDGPPQLAVLSFIQGVRTGQG